jgi:hypothetical protein
MFGKDRHRIAKTVRYEWREEIPLPNQTVLQPQKENHKQTAFNGHKAPWDSPMLAPTRTIPSPLTSLELYAKLPPNF